MKIVKRISLLIITIFMCLSCVFSLSSAEAIENSNEDTVSKNIPEVLLIEDALPWNSEANRIVLSKVTEYDVVTTTDFLKVNLSEYGVVILANDQSFETYEKYSALKEYLEYFASSGGVVVFGACDLGWANGDLNGKLPGNVRKKTHLVDSNYIVDENHPIVSGSLIDNQKLLSSDLVSNYCSHVSFDEESLPAGTKIILREGDSNRPTLIEYPLGKGRVIASGLTWEHNYITGGKVINGLKSGCFAQIAMADMFKYSIHVSNLGVEDVEALNEYYLNNNSHHIIVTNIDSNPVKDAEIVIDGQKYITDERGSFSYTGEYGVKEITVYAKGYRENVLFYDVQPRQFRIVVLEKDSGDRKPYITMVSDIDDFGDLRYQSRCYEEDSDTKLSLKATCNWNGQPEGKYVIFQEGSDKSITSSTGEFLFSPGKTFSAYNPLKIKLVSSNGMESNYVDLNIIIVEKTPEEYLNQEYEFRLPDGASGKVDDAEIAATIPVDFDMRSTVFPVRVYTETSSDGIKTYKVTIGIEQYDFKHNEWLSFKQQIDKGWDKAGSILDNWSGLNGKTGGYNIQTGFINPKIDVRGYYECKKDAKGNIISRSGNILIRGYNKSVYTQQFLLGPMPFYFDLEAFLRLDASGGLQYSEESGFSVPITLAFTPRITSSIGAGVYGLASVGGMVAADGKFPIYPAGQLSESSIKYNIYLRVQLMYVFDWRFSPEGAEKVWYPLADYASYSMLSMDNFKANENVTISPREYNKKTSEWNGGSPSAMGRQNVSEYIHVLQDYIMPNTIPELVKINDDYILIFQSDKSNRAVGNNVVMMYSVYNNDTGVWSQPLEVCEGVSSDLFAEICVDDDELYIVWQKIRTEMISSDPTELLREMSENIDISFAKWNSLTKTFEQSYVNYNNSLDMYPQIAINDGKISVVWVSNTANNAMGGVGEYKIYVSEFENGIWSLPIEIFSTNMYIAEISSGYVNNKLEILFATNIGNYGNIYRIKGETAELISSDDSYGTNVIFRDDCFYWSSSGKIVQYNPERSSFLEITSGDISAISSSYRIVNNGLSTAIVWGGTDENGNDAIFASIHTNNGWSNPIVLMNVSEFIIEFFDVELAKDGAWDIICSLRDKTQNEKVSLTHIHMKQKEETSLNYVNLGEKTDNGMYKMRFSITNNGQNELKKLSCYIKDKSGKTYIDKIISCSIDTGKTSVVETQIDLSGLKEYTELDFVIYAINEQNKSDNIITEPVGQTDVSLKLTQYNIDNKLIIAAEVSNASEFSTNAAISLVENSVDGIILDMKNIGILNNESKNIYLYSIDRSSIDFKGKDYKYYYVVVNTLVEDANEYNNVDVIAVYPSENVESHIHISKNPIWNFDENSRWLTCDDCNEPYNIIEHMFDSACDNECNNVGCGYKRNVLHIPAADDGDCTTVIMCSICGNVLTESNQHTYDNSCDFSCNNEGCNSVRVISHTYKSKYDKDCNVCGELRDAPMNPVIVLLIIFAVLVLTVGVFWVIYFVIKKQTSKIPRK